MTEKHDIDTLKAEVKQLRKQKKAMDEHTKLLNEKDKINEQLNPEGESFMQKLTTWINNITDKLGLTK